MFKILVCDDDAGLRLSVAAALAATGRFDVEEAFDGVNAVEKVKAKTYNMVLLDVDMPRMNGIELVRRIRGDPRLYELPVVIVSYKDREEDRMKGLEAGATHYLAKGGFQDSALVNVVQDLIGGAQEA